MNREFIHIDDSRCIRCGNCAADCPTNLLEMNNGAPIIGNAPCLACGHCTAVCPVGALENEKAPMAEQEEFEPTQLPTAEQAAYFLRTRRSIRGFKPEPVPHEKIKRLLDVANYAPTPGNTQGVSFKVMEHPETLNAIAEAAINWAAKLPQLPWHLSAMVEYFRRTGNDNVLRGAPCLILALMDRNTPAYFRQNGHFLLTYAELYAPMLGLGSCWAGWVESAAGAGDAELLQLLNLPENCMVVGALALGIPRYRHRRIPNRKPVTVSFDRTAEKS